MEKGASLKTIAAEGCKKLDLSCLKCPIKKHYNWVLRTEFGACSVKCKEEAGVDSYDESSRILAKAIIKKRDLFAAWNKL